MIFYFNFYSSLLLIFFVHGLVYAWLCWRKAHATENKSFAWLALYLFMSVLYISSWMLGFAGWYDNQPYKNVLLYTPLNYTWAMGPVMFMYVQSLLNPSFRFRGRQWFHLIPLAIYLLLHLVLVLVDKVFNNEPVLLFDEIDPDYTSLVQLPGLISMIVYLWLGLRYYHLYRRLMVQVVSFADFLLFKWVRNFLLAFLTFVGITILFNIIAVVFDINYTGSWWYYLSFAIIFYYIAISGYSNAIETTVAFQPNLLAYKPALLLGFDEGATDNPIIEDIDYIDIDKAKPPSAFAPDFPLDDWKQKVEKEVAGGKGFEDPDLSLISLARALQTNPSVLSRVINQGFSKNFNDFINHYRVQALQEKLKEGEHHRQTLLSLAYECGFNSKATFNRAFKKHTGLSPKAWVQKHG